MIGSPETLRTSLAAVTGDRTCRGEELRKALTAVADAWLAPALADAGPGFALAAVGSLGRSELAPGSDVDLLLLHADGVPDERVAAVAEPLWYAVWDAKVGLDHSVRTVAEARAVAREDLKAALGLLDLRWIAGDPELVASLRSAAGEDWRRHAMARMTQVRRAAAERADQLGELAHLIEPDVKSCSGGLRDVLAIRAAAAGWLSDAPSERVRAAATWLLDVRGELHRVTGRSSDRLVMQAHRPVADALGVDVDALSRSTSAAGRTIAFALGETWHRIDAGVPQQRRWLGLGGRRSPEVRRRPLRAGVVADGFDVTLARDADPSGDPVLALQVAAAAAQEDLPIAAATLRRLAEASSELPVPWPPVALAAFVEVLEAGRPAVRVIEALDQAELLAGWLPEWGSVRFTPQHNPVHRFTVDRHLVETAVNAAALSRRVSRPDLLVLAALFHDIGKGRPGDHTDVGVAMLPAILGRIGLSGSDAETVTELVRHHLLLPDTATRRDPDDPATTALVVEAVGDPDRLDLLHALTEADALAAGPGAWTDWKAGLVAGLVARAHTVLGGRTVEPAPLLDEAQRALAAAGTVDVAIEAGAAGGRVTVVAPDAPGLLWRWAAVMALHRLEILAATATGGVAGGPEVMAVTVFDVRPMFGSMPDPAVVRSDLLAAIDDPDRIERRLAERATAYDTGSKRPVAPVVLWSDDASAHATVVEVRAHDTTGLLSRLARTFTAAGVTVQRARIQTLGAEVVDAFYVTGSGGAEIINASLRDRLSKDLAAACAPITAVG